MALTGISHRTKNLKDAKDVETGVGQEALAQKDIGSTRKAAIWVRQRRVFHYRPQQLSEQCAKVQRALAWSEPTYLMGAS